MSDLRCPGCASAFSCEHHCTSPSCVWVVCTRCAILLAPTAEGELRATLIHTRAGEAGDDR